MRKLLFLMATLAALSNTTNAQITSDHMFTNKSQTQPILFTGNGTKIMSNDVGGNVVQLYNTDYTLWKTIPIPTPAGEAISVVQHVSDELFNADGSIEVMVVWQMTAAPYTSHAAVISETGTIIADLGIGSYGAVYFIEGVHKLYLTESDNTQVWTLPGSLPCGHCGAGGVGVPKTNNAGGSVAPTAVPNPTSGIANINYTLPAGVSHGKITLRGADGRTVQSYTVSNTDTRLPINISVLPGGVYFYSLEAGGQLPVSGKLVKQ